jgi:soluble lytic murein transglycosylase-like protein
MELSSVYTVISMKKAIVVSLSLALGGCQTFEIEKARPGIHQPPIRELVAEKAKEHAVPRQLAMAIVHVESKFEPNVVNKNNYGLGQISCRTAKGVGFNGPCFTLLDPKVNLTYSMTYLKMALDKADGNWCHAATLYHRGLGNKPKESAYCRTIMRAALLTKP